MNESIKAKGKVKLTIHRGTGEVEEIVVDNLVVNVGLNFIANALVNSSTQPFAYMAVGSGSTTPAATDTTLTTETARALFTTSVVTANSLELTWILGAGVATGTIAEAGIFNAASAGTMLSHALIGPATKGASDVFTIDWVITIN